MLFWNEDCVVTNGQQHEKYKIQTANRLLLAAGVTKEFSFLALRAQVTFLHGFYLTSKTKKLRD